MPLDIACLQCISMPLNEMLYLGEKALSAARSQYSRGQNYTDNIRI